MIKVGNKETTIGIIILVLLFTFALFGVTGLKTIFGVFLFFFLPFYLILDNFDLEKSEKIIFSFFIGIGVFSAFVYYLGMLFNSIRVATAATFVLLLTLGLLLRKYSRARL